MRLNAFSFFFYLTLMNDIYFPSKLRSEHRQTGCWNKHVTDAVTLKSLLEFLYQLRHIMGRACSLAITRIR